MNKITIIGSSVSIRIRPPQELENYSYAYLLNKHLGNWFIINRGKGSFTTEDVINNIDAYIGDNADYYIINMGAVDAPTREISYKFFQILNSQFYPFKFVYATLYKFISKYKTLFVKLRGYKSWISEKKFENNLNTIIKTIKKDTNSKFIIIGINLGSERVERILPKTIDRYRRYNSILEKIAKNNDIPYIDTSHLSNEEYYPDGVHFSTKGHVYIFNKLIEIIDGNR